MRNPGREGEVAFFRKKRPGRLVSGARSAPDDAFVTSKGSILAQPVLPLMKLMNPPAESSIESALHPAPATQMRVIVPVPPEASAAPMTETTTLHAPPPSLYVSGSELILEHGAVIPVGSCVKCGRPACGSSAIALRNPRLPGTWFGARPTLEMGLCRKHRDDRSVAVALTWSFLAIGALLVAVGAMTFSFVSIGIGIVAMAGAGWFRAATPVVATLVTDTRTVLSGCGAAFLKQFRSGGE